MQTGEEKRVSNSKEGFSYEGYLRFILTILLVMIIYIVNFNISPKYIWGTSRKAMDLFIISSILISLVGMIFIDMKLHKWIIADSAFVLLLVLGSTRIKSGIEAIQFYPPLTILDQYSNHKVAIVCITLLLVVIQLVSWACLTAGKTIADKIDREE